MALFAGTKRRVAVDLDAALLDEVDRLASVANVSRNGLVSEAIAAHVRSLVRAEVDAAFAEMAVDPAYTSELGEIAAEFARASDAAWRVAEEVASYATVLDIEV